MYWYTSARSWYQDMGATERPQDPSEDELKMCHMNTVNPGCNV